MVENRAENPITEEEEYPEITHQQIRDRVMQFFEGVDISKDGRHVKGMVLIDTTTDYASGYPTRVSIATVNGAVMASIHNGRYEESYELKGQYKGNDVIFGFIQGELEPPETWFKIRTEDHGFQKIIDPETKFATAQWLGVVHSPYSDNQGPLSE